MPTPFYHLWVAEDLLLHPDLPAEFQERLGLQRSAFLLGSTAPDVQTISGQSRQATHFFTLPIFSHSKPAWEKMLDVHPELTQTDRLSDSRIAFLAGYLCHLQADWLWITNIFTPVFGPRSDWLTFKNRLYLHNVLRSYLDLELQPDLSPSLSDDLLNAIPQDWLPFVDDRHLCQWRDLLVGQLCSGCESQTVAVFATRQGLPVEDFYYMLDSEERMDEEVFVHLPRHRLNEYRDKVVEANVHLMLEKLVWPAGD